MRHMLNLSPTLIQLQSPLRPTLLNRHQLSLYFVYLCLHSEFGLRLLFVLHDDLILRQKRPIHEFRGDLDVAEELSSGTGTLLYLIESESHRIPKPRENLNPLALLMHPDDRSIRKLCFNSAVCICS